MKTCSAIGRGSILAAMLLGAASLAHGIAVQKSFDTFTERLAADWMPANPVPATTQQYFQGAGQDALDRELTAVDAQFGMPLDAAALSAYLVRTGWPRALLRTGTVPLRALGQVIDADIAAILKQ